MKHRTILMLLLGLLSGPLAVAADATAPTAPSQPLEGSATADYDYDSDGKYSVNWSAASDPESGIAAYELQEKVGSDGTWNTLSNAITTTSVTLKNRVHNTQYVYQVRAKNGAGLWGPWSAASDGILVDKTAPSAVTVTDDGATTYSTTQLHATWTASNDPESGIAQYEYLIRQDSTSGSIIVKWTSAGTATEVTHTGLSLTVGKAYFIGVRAQNGAEAYSAISYSDGITVQADTDPPSGSVSINSGDAYTTTATVTLTLSATDNSGTVSQMRFSNDNVTYSAPEPYAMSKTWTLSSGDGTKTVWAQFADAAGNWSTPASDTITLDTTPPAVTITSPQDGAIIGSQ